MKNLGFEKIKLSFKEFEFKTNGAISKAKIKATIFYNTYNKWHEVAEKQFKAKISIKSYDIGDLNKAYKYLKAKLEKDAYAWANKNTEKELIYLKNRLNVFDDFNKKANYIINHNTEYLKTF